MNYIPPPDGPLPEAEPLLDDSDEEPLGGTEPTAGDSLPAGGCSAAAGGVLYSRLRLIHQPQEPSEAVNA